MFQPNPVQVKHPCFLLTAAAEENSVFSSLRLVQSHSPSVGSCSVLRHGPRGEPVPACPRAVAVVPGHSVRLIFSEESGISSLVTAM